MSQELVNQNMEQLFELEVIKSKPVKKKMGGARPGSGRKLGSTQKLSGIAILSAIEKIDKPFAEGLAEDYYKARTSGDLHIIQKYQQMFLNKVIADKQDVDVTSNGQTIGASFTFPSVELPDWQNDQPTTH